MARLSRETKQKRLLQEEMANYTSFFTGEGLFDKIRKKDPKVGLATVYRFLKDLRKRGQIHTYRCKRQMIYSKEKGNHCHFICERCGKIEHFNLTKIDFLKQQLEQEICHFQIDVHGTCNECKKKKSNF